MSIGHHISSDGIDRYVLMPLMAIITPPGVPQRKAAM